MASKVAEKKIQEGDDLMKEADKLTAKTLFRWKPDWEGAVMIYEKAATCYKNARAYEKAKEAFKKASNCHYNMDIGFSAAKNLENAAMMAKETEGYEEAVQLFQQASDIYNTQGSAEKAAETAVAASKLIEDLDPKRAIELLKSALDILETNDKEQFATATYRQTISLLLKKENFEEALEIMHRQTALHEKLNQPHDINKLCLSIIIIHLRRDDYVAADREYKEFMSNYVSFPVSQECRVAGELLDAFEKRSNEDLKTVTSKQIFNFLENQVIRIAKGLKVAGGAQTNLKEEENPNEGLA